MTVPEDEKINAVIVCNALNEHFRWTSFYADNDNEVVCTIDSIVNAETFLTICDELNQKQIDIIDGAYTVLQDFESDTDSCSNSIEPSGTRGQQNALQSAISYLNCMPFSYNGLMQQLEHEGYSPSETKYAVDLCGANWDEQAVLCARNYLDTMPFSRASLISQLEHEGFSNLQAVRAVNIVY